MFWFSTQTINAWHKTDCQFADLVDFGMYDTVGVGGSG